MSFKAFATGVFSAEDMKALRQRKGRSDALLAIGQRLRAARKDAKLERKDIAARCGLVEDQLGRFEHGVNDIDFSIFQNICRVLNLDPLDILIDHMKMDVATAQSTLAMAQTWNESGKPLSVEDLVSMPHPDTSRRG